MANWMTAGRKPYDNLGIVLHRPAGAFFGMALAAMLCHDLPSVGGWLPFFGLLQNLTRRC